MIWGYPLSDYAPGSSPQRDPELDRLADYAVRYYQDRVRPQKKYRPANAAEKDHLAALHRALSDLPETADAETIQSAYLCGWGCGRL